MGIRIDALPTTVAPNQNHVVPAMNEGITVKLSLAQIIALGRTATELANGTDFNTITSNGLFVLTSNVNAPVTGGRWLVSCSVDPAAPGRIIQQAIRITGGDTPSIYTRRSAAGVFGAWSGADSRFVRKDNTGLETMSGPLMAIESLYVQAPANGNAHVWLRDAAGKTRGLLYWDRTPGAVGLRVHADDGNGNDIIVGNLVLHANGTMTFNNDTVWHSGIALDAFVQGLTLSNNAADPNNKIDIAPGRARGNGVTVVNPATITVALGAMAPNATYHIHALRNNATGGFWVAADVSPTSPDVPPGYTHVQRLGAVLTDGSGNIRPFVQDGNEFRYAVSGGNGVSAYGSTVGNRAYSLLTCPVPTGVRLKLLLSLTLATVSAPNPQDGGEAIFGDGANTDVRTHIHRWGLDPGDSAGIAFWTMDPVSVRTNTSGQIYFGIQSASGSYGSQLWVRGWIDERIPRIGT